MSWKCVIETGSGCMGPPLHARSMDTYLGHAGTIPTSRLAVCSSTPHGRPQPGSQPLQTVHTGALASAACLPHPAWRLHACAMPVLQPHAHIYAPYGPGGRGCQPLQQPQSAPLHEPGLPSTATLAGPPWSSLSACPWQSRHSRGLPRHSIVLVHLEEATPAEYCPPNLIYC